MPCLKDWKKKIVIYEINVLLAEMGFFSKLKKKKIKFQSKFVTNSQQSRIENFNTTENIVDLSFDIGKDIDKLLEKHEKRSQNKLSESILKTRQEIPFNEVIEIRNPEIKRPEIPNFTTDLNTMDFYGELDKSRELFEVEIPNNIIPKGENKQYYNPDFNNYAIGDNKKPQRSFMDLGRIKFWNKSSNQNQVEPKKENGQFNNFTKTKIGLEKTKRDIEQQERVLDYAKKLENQMKDELKKKDEQKKKEEKLRRLEHKKKIKEDKLRKLQADKAKKQIEKEEKRLEREKLKEERLKEKELKKLELKRLNEEKLKNREIERLEKQKIKEIKRLEEDKKKAEKQKEILLKEKQEELKRNKLEKETQGEIKPQEPPEMGQFIQKEAILKEKQEELKRNKLEKETQGEIKPQEPPEMGQFIQKETATKNEKPYLDDDVEKLLPIIDQLLEKLPDDVVDEFAQSDNFALYEKVINKYKRK